MGLPNNLGKLSNMITSTGSSVGIGTTSPNDLLEVSGGFIRLSASAGNGPQFNIYSNGQTNNHVTLAQGFALATDNVGYLYNRANAAFVFGTNNAERMRITSSGNVGIGTSSPDYPLVVQANSGAAQAVKLLGRSVDNISILSFHNNANNTQYGYIAGIPSEFRINSGSGLPITFTNLDTERMRITSGGNVQIGTTSGSVERLRVRGFDSTNGYDCAYFENGGGSKILELRNDGLLSTGTLSYSPYNLSITPGRALYVDSSGTFGYVASVRESKTNINTLGSVDWIKNLNPVSFNYRKKDENNQYTDEFSDDIFYGLIADEVEKIDSNLVFYDVKQNGEKELKGVYYEKLTAVLIKAIQELSAKVTALENK